MRAAEKTEEAFCHQIDGVGWNERETNQLLVCGGGKQKSTIVVNKQGPVVLSSVKRPAHRCHCINNRKPGKQRTPGKLQGNKSVYEKTSFTFSPIYIGECVKKQRKK